MNISPVLGADHNQIAVVNGGSQSCVAHLDAVYLLGDMYLPKVIRDLFGVHLPQL